VNTHRFVSLPALLVLVTSCTTSPPASTETEPGSLAAPPWSTPDCQSQDTGEARGDGEDQALKQANNPLANMKAVSLHNYYMPELSETEESANTFWLRYAQPATG